MDVAAASSIPASVIYYRKAFHYATRTGDESIETWYMRLKTLAEPCLFGDMYNAFLLNKFVVDMKDDCQEQLNGINMKDEWTLNSLESELNREQPDVYFEEILYQVKDEVMNEENDNDWSATANVEYACMPAEEPVRKKRKYTRKAGANGGKKRSEKVVPAEATVTQIAPVPPVAPKTEDTTDKAAAEPRPKKRQFRTPLKLFCESCPSRNFKYKCKFEMVILIAME